MPVVAAKFNTQACSKKIHPEAVVCRERMSEVSVDLSEGNDMPNVQIRGNCFEYEYWEVAETWRLCGVHLCVKGGDGVLVGWGLMLGRHCPWFYTPVALRMH
jgi:hypothetical protein